MKLVVVIFQALFLQRLLSAQKCSTPFYSIYGKVFRGHVIDKGFANNFGECMNMCHSSEICKSVNFYLGKRLCELNKFTDRSHPQSVTQEDTGIYVSVRVVECGKEAKPLGMADGSIPDNRITGSGTKDNRADLAPYTARLNGPGGWFPSGNVPGAEWLQIDLAKGMVVSGVATQGRAVHTQWLTEYKVQHGQDGSLWYPVKAQDGTDMVFVGNSDQHTVVKNDLPQAVFARFIRIIPWKFYDPVGMTDGDISFRAELYGCTAP